MTTELHVTCADCQGKGHRIGYACPGFRRVKITCAWCGGFGQVLAELAEKRAVWRERGAQMRAARVESGESLREAAARLGVSPVQYSRIEHGLETLP